MSRWLARVGAIIAVASLLATAAVADKDKKKPAAMPKCSACKMELVAKKDDKHPTAVKVKGKTFYCCADCPMGKAKPGKKK